MITFIKALIRSVFEGQRSISPNLSPMPLEPVANCPSNIKSGEMHRFALTTSTFNPRRFAGALHWWDQAAVGRSRTEKQAMHNGYLYSIIDVYKASGQLPSMQHAEVNFLQNYE